MDPFKVNTIADDQQAEAFWHILSSAVEVGRYIDVDMLFFMHSDKATRSFPLLALSGSLSRQRK